MHQSIRRIRVPDMRTRYIPMQYVHMGIDNEQLRYGEVPVP